jgi:hypothetical protein
VQGPRGERGVQGPKGDEGNGIEDILSAGADVLIKLTNGDSKRFRISTAIPIGGGGSGVSALSALSDVALTSPQHGDSLVYDSATGKWINDYIPRVIVSATEPSDPRVGDIWIDIS